jgi:superfamily I DNA/RNA helicase
MTPAKAGYVQARLPPIHIESPSQSGSLMPSVNSLTVQLKHKLATALASCIPEHLARLAAEAHEKGRAQGHEAGRTEGHEDGHKEGLESGQRAGFLAGQRVYRIAEPSAVAEEKPLDKGIYGPDRLDVAKAEQAMRQGVALRVSQGDLKEPTEDQWSMILSDHPASCIAAGAGSGKSTTLVLRVVFMLCHLGIRDEDLTVISFTRDSCAELRHALRRVLGLWRKGPITDAWLKTRVRTFHSLLYGLTNTALPGRQFFELMKKDDTEDEAAEIMALDVDNPMANLRLNDRQAEVLLTAYRDAFAKDERFRRNILRLLDAELLSPSNSPIDKAISSGRMYFASLRDSALTEMVSQTWIGHGWPAPGVDIGAEGSISALNKHVFLANGVDERTGLPVFLGFAPNLSQAQRNSLVTDPTGEAGDEAFSAGLAFKLRVLSNYAGKPYILIRSKADMDRFHLRQKFLAAEAGGTVPEAPVFPLKIRGEVGSSLIHEALYTQGSFMESLGKSVNDLIKEFPAPKVEDSTVHFYRALAGYWSYFAQTLEARDLHTYNQAFLLMSANAETMAFGPRELGAVRHLLVDEFQDISPLIANWLKAMHRRLIRDAQDKPLSVMAIGDDWQSIYGWRGSAPQLFIDFAAFFPSHADVGPAPELFLRANYRSVPAIVEDAKRLIARVSVKVDKPVEPIPVARPGDHGVVLAEYAPDNPRMEPEDAAKILVPFIRAEYASATNMVGPKPEHLIVMTRRRKMRDTLQRAFPEVKYPGLRFCTYHQAKGLEADVAILVEDCAPGDTHPLRNLAYQASGLYKRYTYDQATIDEAWRLAYVGVTRGRRRTFWQVPSIAQTTTARVYASP